MRLLIILLLLGVVLVSGCVDQTQEESEVVTKGPFQVVETETTEALRECNKLTDLDEFFYCTARVTKETKWCDKIRDQATAEACIAEIG